MKNSRAGIEDGILPAKMYVLQRFLESELQATDTSFGYHKQEGLSKFTGI